MIRRWLLFLILLLPIPFAALFILLLPSGSAPLPPADGIAFVNAALACLALVGIAAVLLLAAHRFHRKNSEI